MEDLSDEESENLINLVSQRPSIYDINHPDYKNYLKKANNWKEIAKELNKSREHCKKLWRTIRDSYKRFKRKNKLTSGSAAPKNKRTKWKIYRLLSFLDDVEDRRSNRSYRGPRSKKDDESESSDNGDEESTESEQFINQPAPNAVAEAVLQYAEVKCEQVSPTSYQDIINRRRSHSCSGDISPYMTKRKRPRHSTEKTEDEFKSFANHIELVLKKLPKLLQIQAKQEMFEVLTRYEIMAVNSADHSGSNV